MKFLSYGFKKWKLLLGFRDSEDCILLRIITVKWAKRLLMVVSASNVVLLCAINDVGIRISGLASSIFSNLCSLFSYCSGLRKRWLQS